MKKNKIINSGMNFRLASESNIGINSIASKTINYLSRVLIVLLLSLGSIFTFTSMMHVKINEVTVCLVAVAASMCFTALYRRIKRKWLVFVISLAAVLIGGLFMFGSMKTAVTAIYDSTVKSIYDAMYWTAPDPILKWRDFYITDTTWFVSLFTVVVAAAVAYFSVARTQFIGIFLITFPFFEIGAAFGCVPNRMAFVMLMGGWAAMLTLHISNRQRNIVMNKNGKLKRKSKQFAYKDRAEKFGGSALLMSIAIILCFTLISNILVSNGFERSDKLNNLRETVREATINAVDLITGVDHDASLKDGRLYELADRKVKNRHYATLEMPDISQDIYLKGYVGSVYTGNKWEAFEDDRFKEISSVKSFFGNIGVTLPTATGDTLDSYIGGKNLKYGKFKLSEFRRDKDYMYIHSGTVSNVEFKGYQDYKTVTEKDEYEYTAYYEPYDFVNIPYCIVSGSSEYKTQWSKYINFVESNYTLLPEGIDEIAKLGQQFRGNDVYEIVDLVRDFLSENTEYSDYVQKLPDDKEFASYFVFEKGVGYSPHYATASAVMLRALGIPTRYVEGYLVQKAQIDEVKAVEGRKTVEITDGNHHAWIEIFDSTYGWIPIEVTPGYYTESFAQMMHKSEEEAEDNKEQVDNNKNNNQQETPEEEQPEENKVDGEFDPQAEEGKESEDQVVEVKTDFFKKYNIFAFLFIAVAILFVAVLITVFVFVIRRARIISKRQKVFNSTDYRKQVILGFTLLIKMLEFKGVDINSTYSYVDLRENFVKNCPQDIDADIEMLFDIYEKALFSKLLITEEHASAVLDFVDELGYDLYANSTLGVRLKIKYLKVLL